MIDFLKNKQHTIAKRIEVVGIGLHSGRNVRLEILPGAINSGIVFKRVDLPGSPSIQAHVSNIHSTDLNTTIAAGEARVSTIEHLMSAFAGLGIDNALVKIDGPEVPVMDGSAAPFVDRILLAGISAQSAHRKYFVIRKPVEMNLDGKSIRVEPCDDLTYSMEIDFSSKAIGRQSIDFNLSRESYLELAGSRTFCHINDVTAMRNAGLALGGSMANAVVVDDQHVLNPEGLRFANEFVRHKLLDCIGDLYLFGGPIIGKFSATKSGHGMHASFLKLLWASRHECLSVVEDIGILKANQKSAAVAGAIA